VNARHLLSLALDPAHILLARGLEPDPWQRRLLLSGDRQILLNCSRQAGKSTVVSALALHMTLFTPASLVLLLSPSQRQSCEIFRKVIEAYNALGRPVRASRETQLRLELTNGSRIVCLPGREETVRSFGGVNLLVLDEAARIRDDLYRSVRPMLAVSRGRLIALSTPFGQRGWFYDEWQGDGSFHKIRITWKDCPRIAGEFIAQEVQSMGEQWVRQEYECEFSALAGLVYPDFALCMVGAEECPERGRNVGGIDFGWRNPFAAVWGLLDGEDVLWIIGERYLRETPLHEHREALKALGSIMWYGDPAGRTETEELRSAGLAVRQGDNDIAAGIAAVTARIRTGRLRVCQDACPNLVRESRHYRYPSSDERAVVGENPIDRDNHALAALRYLISRLDERFMAKLRKHKDAEPPEPNPTSDDQTSEKKKRPWLRLDNEELWM
jgi:Terminase large subunit, T4likevirus-type, N-terminal/Terminase RNaseH-like domain